MEASEAGGSSIRLSYLTRVWKGRYNALYMRVLNR